MDKLENALHYQELGFCVLPLHTVHNGICSCGKGESCSSPGKHPRTKNGVKDASNNPSVIKQWFEEMPDSNIGIATGKINNIIAIDIDYRSDGEIGFEMLESEFGKLPYTVEQHTGGGGRHLLFKHPGFKVDNRVGIAHGVDIRGDGGYIVVAPSIHKSGNEYVWEVSSTLGEVEMAELSDGWKHLLKDKPNSQQKQFNLSVTIPEGARNGTLFNLASSFQAKGLFPEEIKAAISSVNTVRCTPPLSDQELERIVNSVQRYKRGTLEIVNEKTDRKKETNLIRIEDIETKEVDWLWEPYIPLGKITIIQGDPGGGKTTLALKIASIVSNEGFFPGEEDVISREAGNVIYQTAEDGLADTIKPRLEKMGADCTNIYVIDESQQGLTLSDDRIEEAMRDKKPQLLIIDPLQAYLGAKIDMHRANEVRPILSKLSKLAEKYNCAVLLIVHQSKASHQKALYRSLGSIDFAAAARSILFVGKNPDTPQERVVTHVKSSLAQAGKSITFELDSDYALVWKGECNLADIDIDSPVAKTTQLERSKDFLKDILQDGREIAANEIMKKAKELGLSDRTISRAKADLGIQSKRLGYQGSNISVWYIPASSQEIVESEKQTLPNLTSLNLAMYADPIENKGFSRTLPS